MNDAASRSHFFFTAYIHGKNEVCFCYDLWVLDKLFEFSLVIEYGFLDRLLLVLFVFKLIPMF